MDDFTRALGDIRSIRRQVARSTEFRGYGPATLASTGGFAIVAAVVQAFWLRDPRAWIPAYLGIWIVTALASAALIGVQAVTRAHRMHSGMADEMISMAVEQFLPAAAAGVLVTFVLVQYVPGVLWMLPGLWQIIFSLGVFSSCRFLPRAMALVGIWYLLAGLVCLSLGGSQALSPWAMGGVFGAGQCLAAGILFLTAPEGNENEAGNDEA